MSGNWPYVILFYLSVMNASIHAGLRWLTRSGIQDESGGLAGSYRAPAGQYEGVLTTATGFFISGLLRCAEYPPENPPKQAMAAGRVLIEKAYDTETELFVSDFDSAGNNPRKWAYFLDCLIAIRALIDLWKATKDSAYIGCAEKCGIGIKRNLSRMDGSFFPVHDLARDMPYEADEPWSLQSAVHHLKALPVFLELTEATGLYEFKAMGEDLLQWTLKRHESFLEPDSDSERLMSRLHGYCYFLEGLLPEAGRDPDCSRALQYGLLEIENISQEIGHDYHRCDVIAQLLRLRLYADRLGIMELDFQQAENEAAAIEELQVQSADPKIDGGFAFALKASTPVQHYNPATTVLAIQALQMWEQAAAGSFREGWETLI